MARLVFANANSASFSCPAGKSIRVAQVFAIADGDTTFGVDLTDGATTTTVVPSVTCSSGSGFNLPLASPVLGRVGESLVVNTGSASASGFIDYSVVG